MPNIEPHIGTRLKDEMRRRELTPTQVADIFGVKNPSVYDWINFGRIAKKHIPKLIETFGHDAEWWITGKSKTPTLGSGPTDQPYASLSKWISKAPVSLSFLAKSLCVEIAKADEGGISPIEADTVLAVIRLIRDKKSLRPDMIPPATRDHAGNQDPD